MTVDAAKNKSDGLLAYVREQNRGRKGGKLRGGIVAPENPPGNAGNWKIYAGKGKDLTGKNLSNWEWLQFPPPQ